MEVMRRAMGIVLAFGIMSAGCLRSGGGKAGEALMIGGASAGFVYGVACADYHDGQHRCDSTDAQVAGFAILGALVGGVVLAIYSESTYKPPALEEPAAPATYPAAGTAVGAPDGVGGVPALYEPVQARDPQAHQMTIAAHRAAWQGQCGALPALAQRVNALDPEYYTRVFYGDPAIQRCMQAR
jgi:hypothetical protein